MTAAEEEFQQVISREDIKQWTLYTDGSSNVNETGLGLVLISPNEDIIAYLICCDFKATNNEAEYEALILGLTTAKDMKVRHIDVNCDSLLIVNQVNVPKENNVQADALAGLGAVFKGLSLNNIPVIHIMKHAVERLVHEMDVLALDQCDNNSDQVIDSWIQTYMNYLQLRVKPSNNNEARILRMKASRFMVMDNKMFKKSSTGILERCLKKHEADMVLRDAHEGECGNHTNERNLSLKILFLGYYWPTLRQDAL
ncbi:uncharacterized protein LOC141719482 [Apium graveolens]|uniref:uncharacterized protein LOC141719482 n=1 Tax=Apium graveolens TaxID=4045 RepID=UPI003D7BAA91